MAPVGRRSPVPLRARAPACILLVLALLLACPSVVGRKASKARAGGNGAGSAGLGSDGGSADPCPGLSRGELDSFDRLLQRAAQLSRTHALNEAQACLESALRMASTAQNKAHVLFNLAVIARQRGDVEGAKKILLQAPTEGVRGWAQAHMFLGILQLESGESRKALKSLARAKRLSPQDAAIYRDMAQAYYNLGEAPKAVHVWEEGVVNMPTSSEGFFNLGLLQREMGGASAERCYMAAVRLLPSSARFRYSFGNLLYDRNRLREAAAVYKGALRLDPSHEDSLNNLGNALRQLGKLEGARAAFEGGLVVNPVNTNFLLNAGQVYQDLGLQEETGRVAEEAFRLNPALIEASILRGSVAYGRGELEGAIQHYRRAVALDPTAQQPLLNLANSLGDLYRSREARVSNQHAEARAEMHAIHAECVAVYERMLLLRPDDAEAFLNGFWARKYACDWSHWSRNMAQMHAMVRQQLARGKAPSLKPFLALAFPISAALYLEIAAAHAKEEADKAATIAAIVGTLGHSLHLLPPLQGTSRPRVRLAYVSTDLGDHPVGHQAWFMHHRREMFDVVLLALSHDDNSEWWQRTKAMVPAGNFHELGKLGRDISASDFAFRINALGVHILVTLNGWTSGHQMDTLALRPAALQVEYMGSHDSTGAEFMQAFVSDRVASPPELARFYSERLILAPDSFFINEYSRSRSHVPPLADAVYYGRLAHEPLAVAGDLGAVTREAYGLPKSGIVASNFNQLFKVDPSVFEVWMALLKSIPDAYLWLLRLPSTAERALRAEAARHGTDVAARLIFSDRISWKNHLVVKALANISLDNPVFNSHTSGVDILWAGVPLLTLAGETMSSRVAASLLSALPFPSLIARSLKDYQEIAQRLLAPPHRRRLHEWRQAVQQARAQGGAAGSSDTGERGGGSESQRGAASAGAGHLLESGVERGGGVLFDSRRLVGHLERGLLIALSVLIEGQGRAGEGGGGGGGGRASGLGAHAVVHAAL
eukprot:Tamp_03999.p1 GENE.Tamp_03999~~Tamp_03999.p1  ORF type:complete len:997 (+),score=159.38 Tamp_03999:212-3202(+)